MIWCLHALQLLVASLLTVHPTFHPLQDLPPEAVLPTSIYGAWMECQKKNNKEQMLFGFFAFGCCLVLGLVWFIYFSLTVVHRYSTKGYNDDGGECMGDYSEKPLLPVLVNGNGYCDNLLNTAGCDYDGGDCCKETCVPTVGDCSLLCCQNPEYEVDSSGCYVDPPERTRGEVSILGVVLE